MADNQFQDSGTVIGADTFIKGDMEVENRAKILGRFEGTITAKGQVEVADKASCKATVNANTVQVDGSVEGDITASDKVQLNATARVKGDLVATKLVVTEGAAFNGHLTVGPDASRSAGSSNAAAGESGSREGSAPLATGSNNNRFAEAGSNAKEPTGQDGGSRVSANKK